MTGSKPHRMLASAQGECDHCGRTGVRLVRCCIRDHLLGHGTYVPDDVSELRGVRVDWQLALNECNTVDAADGRIRVLFPEAQYDFHTTLLISLSPPGKRGPGPGRHQRAADLRYGFEKIAENGRRTQMAISQRSVPLRVDDILKRPRISSVNGALSSLHSSRTLRHAFSVGIGCGGRPAC
jgi:hypothetical protein